MGTLCCWAAAGAVVGLEAGPELSEGAKESCSAVLQGENKNKKHKQWSGLIPAFAA